MSRVSSGLSGAQSLTIVTSIDIAFTIFGGGPVPTKLPSAQLSVLIFVDKHLLILFKHPFSIVSLQIPCESASRPVNKEKVLEGAFSKYCATCHNC